MVLSLFFDCKPWDVILALWRGRGTRGCSWLAHVLCSKVKQGDGHSWLQTGPLFVFGFCMRNEIKDKLQVGSVGMRRMKTSHEMCVI